MVNFRDLNLCMGVFLYKVESEEDFADFKFFINAVGRNIIIDIIKEGYFSKVPDELENDGETNKKFYNKIKKIDLKFITQRDVPDDSLFEYVGKKVIIEFETLHHFFFSHYKGEVLSVVFDKWQHEFVLLVPMKGGKMKTVIHKSDIKSIVIVE